MLRKFTRTNGEKVWVEDEAILGVEPTNKGGVILYMPGSSQQAVEVAQTIPDIAAMLNQHEEAPRIQIDQEDLQKEPGKKGKEKT